MISEKIHININGIEQGMFIKGERADLPVILFLHGGPGMPEYPLTDKYKTPIESHFIVCWWEQRGASLSYHKGMDYSQITSDLLVEDVIAVTQYLCKRFGREKIILMAHSFGTFIGIKAVRKAPQLFHAYVGIAQIAYQLMSERFAYSYMIDQYHLRGDECMARKLKRFDLLNCDTIPTAYVRFRDKPMHQLGIGTMRHMRSVIKGIFFPIMEFKGYTLRERIRLWIAKSKLLNRTHLWDETLSTNLVEEIKSVEVPIYFCHGIHDHTVNYALTKKFFDTITAPRKGFYTFSFSAHSPLFEEPDKFVRILTEDVVERTIYLADLQL